MAALDGAEGLINLTGRSVNCIKTPDHCDEILRSRVEATRVLGEALRTVVVPPRVWVQMSTAHIYGDPPDGVCDEARRTATDLRRSSVVSASRLSAMRGQPCRTSAVWCGERASCSAVTGAPAAARSRASAAWPGSASAARWAMDDRDELDPRA
jgi:hypothetical protein